MGNFHITPFVNFSIGFYWYCIFGLLWLLGWLKIVFIEEIDLNSPWAPLTNPFSTSKVIVSITLVPNAPCTCSGNSDYFSPNFLWDLLIFC